MAVNNSLSKKYIYDLPYAERTQLCNILDQDKKWEELGGIYMEYTYMEIDSLRREFFRCKSPTHELLEKWGHDNHTITELFVLLSRMHHYQAMRILEPFVDPKYHPLIYKGEENLSQPFKTLNATSSNVPASSLPLDSKAIQDPSQDDAGLMSVAGAPGSPQPHKTMDYGQHNINTTKAANLLVVNQVELPPELAEEKIMNEAGGTTDCSPLSSSSNRTLSSVSQLTAKGKTFAL